MDYLEKEREQEEIERLIAENKEDNDPDFRQYGFLKWKGTE